MSILLSYADTGDGTGGVISLTGSVAGSNNQLYAAKHAGGMGFAPYALAGSRVGDGVIAVTLTEGPYHCHILSNDSGTLSHSVPLSFRVHSEKLSVQERTAWAIRDFVLGLNLAGVPTDPASHVVAKVGAKLETVLRNADPDEAVYYLPAPEGYRVADNAYNSIRFPVVVSLLKRSRQTLSKGFTDVLRYREKLQGSISACELADVPEVHTIDFQPGAVIDPAQWLDDFDASNLTIVCTAELPAGVQ